MNVAAVKSPGFGDRRRDSLYDIAALTDGTVVTGDDTLRLENIKLEHLGKARKVTITREATTIVDGRGNTPAIAARVDLIKEMIKQSGSDFDRDQLQQRLAKLTGGIGVINVGAQTEPEIKEKKDRVDDALAATRAAVEEGIVPGGGTALLKAKGAIAEAATRLEGDEAIGARLVEKSVEAPIRQLCKNAGVDGSQIVLKILELGLGYNVATDEYVDLLEAGIVDPTKVTRSALQNAGSVAGMLLTTECLIVNEPTSASAEAPHEMGSPMSGMM